MTTHCMLAKPYKTVMYAVNTHRVKAMCVSLVNLGKCVIAH